MTFAVLSFLPVEEFAFCFIDYIPKINQLPFKKAMERIFRVNMVWIIITIWVSFILLGLKDIFDFASERILSLGKNGRDVMKVFFYIIKQITWLIPNSVFFD